MREARGGLKDSEEGEGDGEGAKYGEGGGGGCKSLPSSSSPARRQRNEK